MLRSVLRLTCPVALIVLIATAPGAAQTLDKRTVFKFSGPVSVPGVTLPAGEYMFRLANPTSGRNVVQVLSADGTIPYAMFFSMHTLRPEPAEVPEVTFMETAANMPAAIQTWWYPGERTGYEFVYPREQRRRLTETPLAQAGVTGAPIVGEAAPLDARPIPARPIELASAGRALDARELK